MKKQNSYQKMKLKYELQIHKLQEDLITLLEDNDVERICLLRLRYKLNKDIENSLMFGDPT